MPRSHRISKRQRRFAATCRVLHYLKPRRVRVPDAERMELLLREFFGKLQVPANNGLQGRPTGA